MIALPAGLAAGAAGGYTVVGHLLGSRIALKRSEGLTDAVALTFDDGPMPESTPPILECLSEHDVPATFFMVGERVEQHADLARAVVEAGHEAANHTYSHRHAWTLHPAATMRAVRRCHEAVAGATGTAPRAMRPPWGVLNACTVAAAKRVGERVVLWSVRSEGYWWRPTADEMVEHIVGRARGGDIINLHDAGGFPDTPERVLAALPGIIERLRARGLRFVTISEML